MKRLLLLILVLIVSFSAFGQKKIAVKKAEVRTPPPSTDKSCFANVSITELDVNAASLPANFYGNDLQNIYKNLNKRTELKKDEFETTKQFHERRDLEYSKPVHGSLTANSYLAFQIDVDFEYNADREEMWAKMPERAISWAERCQSEPANSLGSRKYQIAFSENYSYPAESIPIPMPIPQARLNKPNLRALIIGKFSEISRTTSANVGELNLIPKQLWLYNFPTGEIYKKIDISPPVPIDNSAARRAAIETETLLEQARAFYKSGRDDDAMRVLLKIINGVDPTSYKAYFIIGNIYERRGDLEQAIDAYKTAVFWDSNLIDGHIRLGKIYLEKKDCRQAESYAASALAIDGTNQEAISLQKRVERCF